MVTLNLTRWNEIAAGLLVLAAVYSVIAARRTDLPWGRPRIVALVLCRALLLIALAAWCLELQFNLTLPAKRVDLIVLADRSPSLSPRGHQQLDQWLARAHEKMASAGTLSIIDFGNSDPAHSSTPIAEAIEHAQSLFTGAAEKRILLLSDGRWTTTDPQRLANPLQSENVKVFAVPLDPLANESLIAGLTTAPAIWRNVPAPVGIHLYAPETESCRLKLLLDNKQIEEREVTLPPGESVVEMSVTPDSDGVHAIEVRAQFSHDTLPWNNTVSALVDVPLAPRIVMISEPGDAGQLMGALNAAGLGPATRVIAPEKLPPEFNCDCVILNNVPAASLGQPRLAALEQFVRNGGGIVFTGGAKSFGAGGYLTTPLEPAFPVLLMPDKEQPPYALVITLDNSWSMNEGITSSVGKINLAKEIAITAMDNLNKGDWLALVSFDSDYHNIIDPIKVGNLAPAKYETSRIGAFGMTNILGGLTEALRLIQKMDAGYKHIVLITDGHETETGTDYSRLLATLDHEHITLSTIGVGLEPDEKLLNTLAYAGKGRYYAAKSLQEIPAIMLQEAKGMGDPLVVSAPLPVKKMQEDPALAGLDLEKFPEMGGYNRTRARPHAWTPLVISRKNEPLLARMRYGRGQSLAFTSATSGAWARDWLTQNPAAYATFWRQAVLSVLGSPYQPLAAAEEFQEDRPILKLAEAPEGKLEVHRLSGGAIAAAAPGTSFDLAGSDAVLITAKGKLNQAASWSHNFGQEFGDPAAGIKSLEQLSRATGGAMGDSDAPFAPAHLRRLVQTDPAAWLVAALVLLVVELLLRRLPALTSAVRRRS